MTARDEAIARGLREAPRLNSGAGPLDPTPFYDHLDACERCREHPFDLCHEGSRILLGAVLCMTPIPPRPVAPPPGSDTETTHTKDKE